MQLAVFDTEEQKQAYIQLIKAAEAAGDAFGVKWSAILEAAVKVINEGK